VNVTDHLLNYSTARPAWNFTSADETPLLPLGIPISGVEIDVAEISQLLEAYLMVLDGRPHVAWHAIQLNLSWRNNCEAVCERGHLPEIRVQDWLVIATVALAIDEIEDAERYASEAVSRVHSCFRPFIGDLLCDPRADVMSVFAMVKLAQGEPAEAEDLLELAYDAHVQAGDLTQMAVDLIILADVKFLQEKSQDGLCLLHDADNLLKNRCDYGRHILVGQLRAALHDRLKRNAPSWALN